MEDEMGVTTPVNLEVTVARKDRDMDNNESDDTTLDGTADLTYLHSTNGNNPMRNVWIETAEKATKLVLEERVKFFTKANMEFSNPYDNSVNKTDQRGFVC